MGEKKEMCFGAGQMVGGYAVAMDGRRVTKGYHIKDVAAWKARWAGCGWRFGVVGMKKRRFRFRKKKRNNNLLE